MDAVVILAGEEPAGQALKILREKAAQGCLLIAADAGADRLAAAGFQPDIIVGDGDSLQGSFPQAWRIKYQKRKNFTDGEAALQLALDRCNGWVWVLGALGGRPDHQLANLLMPLHSSAPERVRLAGADWQGRYITAGWHVIEGRPGDTVSLLPLTPVSGLTLSGFEYPLQYYEAQPGDSRTMSNVLSAEAGRISLSEGCLLAFSISDPKEYDKEYQHEADR